MGFLSRPSRDYPAPVLGSLINVLCAYEPDLTDLIGDMVPLIRLYRDAPPLHPDVVRFQRCLAQIETRPPPSRPEVEALIARCRLYWECFESRWIRRSLYTFETTPRATESMTKVWKALPRITWDLDHLAKQPAAHIEPFPDVKLPTLFESRLYLRLLHVSFHGAP